MRKVRISLGAKDIYGMAMHAEDYKKIYDVKGETPLTVIIVVRGEKWIFNKRDIIYNE